MSLLRVAALMMGLGACSLSYVDQDGRRHVVGLVYVVVQPAHHPAKAAGDIVDLTTIGLAISNDEGGSRVALGYSRDVFAALHDDALVLGNPLAVLGEPERTAGTAGDFKQ